MAQRLLPNEELCTDVQKCSIQMISPGTPLTRLSPLLWSGATYDWGCCTYECR